MVNAFVERWQPETNTFHLPFGEMSITLEDVSMLLKIPVTGKVVALDDPMTRTEAVELLVEALDVSRVEAEAEVQKKLSVSHRWLKSRWCPKRRPVAYPRVECTARAYLLYMLSCTLFVDKSSSRAPVSLLKIINNLEDVANYAWGAAALAYLYRQLGCASRVDVSQIAGYLTLLEVIS